MPRYDVFIAYAGPNAPHARQLFDALAESLGEDRVFFDREQLSPGALWYQEIPAALADSRMTVAVLARDAGGGWYDKSEFLIAIDQVRRGDHVLIPVFVDGMPERMVEWPYGLQNLNAIDARARGGLAAAAEEILELLRQLPASGIPEVPRPRTRRQLLNAALHLDRSDQWGAIQRIAHGDDDAYFLLYGQTFQNLRLFLERILHRLGKEVRPHLVLELPYRLDGSYPANVPEWDLRLLTALKSRLRRRAGRLENLLRAAAASQPLFLIIELPWNQRFEAPHASALKGFLEDRLPLLMGTSGGKAKRLLVTAEYFEREMSRHREIGTWMRKASARGVRYEPMAEVETPSRSDVVVFLGRLGFEEGHPEFDYVMSGYDQLALNPLLDFRSLCDFLDEQLRDPMLERSEDRPPPEPVDPLLLAFRLVIARQASPDLLQHLRVGALRDAAEKYSEGASDGASLHKTLRRLEEEQSGIGPNPLWLAWMRASKTVQLETLGSELLDFDTREGGASPRHPALGHPHGRFQLLEGEDP